MLKALFLDMDETLCDTTAANEDAMTLMAKELELRYKATPNGKSFDGAVFSRAYLTGIYRSWTPNERERYMPIIENESEGAFRLQLILDLLAKQGVEHVDTQYAQHLQTKFDADRIANFRFYPGIADFLVEARRTFTLVVITNGPEFSQLPKINAVDMPNYVDHIIVGGQEPEQKPARSIFEKALNLAGCEAHEAIHVGDSLAADIVGAQNCGINALWIQHQQPLDAELNINPAHSVLHPSEIPNKIKALSA